MQPVKGGGRQNRHIKAVGEEANLILFTTVLS